MSRRYSEADLRAMIPLYLEGALDDDELAAVLAYCAEHPEALQTFAESSRLIDILDEAITPVAVDSEFTGDVLTEIESLSPAGRWWSSVTSLPALTVIRWAAEAALLGLLTLLLVLHPWAPTINPVQCQLLGQSRWTIGQPAAVRLIVRHREVAEPVVNAMVRLRLFGEHSRETLFRGRTNDEGSIDLEYPLPADQPPGDYRLVADVETPLGRAVVQHAMRLVAAPKLRLEPVTDRVAAGDSLQAWLTAGQAAPAAVQWRLDDRFGRAMAQGGLDLTASRQALLEVPLGPHAPPGPATLWVRCGSSSAALPVAVLPGSATALEPRIELTRVDQDALSGRVDVLVPPQQAVAGAEVGLKLIAADGSTRLHGRTDAGGVWRWSAPVPADVAEPVLLQAFARDSRARQGEAWRSVSLPERLSLTATPVGGLVEGLDAGVELAASEPVAAIDWSWNGDPWRTLRGRRGEIRVRPRAGENRLLLRAESATGWVRSNCSLTALSAAMGLQVQPARRLVVGGESVRVDVRTPGDETRVYLDLTAAGQTIATRSLTLANGRGSLVLHLPPSLPERVTLRAYAPRGDGWRHGEAVLTARPAAPLKVEVAPRADERLEVAARRGEDPAQQPVLLAAVRDGDAPRDPGEAREPAARVGFDLLANSVAAARRQALGRQREFFERSPLLGGVAGGLLFACFVLWFYQLFTDPYEYVNRRERRVWGRVPQVHRRGTWAGLGMLLFAVFAAAAVSGGILLAGRQARELASSAGEPLDVWQPRSPSWLSAAVGPLERNLAWAVPAPPTGSPAREVRTEWLRPDAEGNAIAAPLGPGIWKLRAYTSDSPPAAAGTIERGAEPSLELGAPEQLHIGDELVVPVTLLNPTEQRLPAVVEAEVDTGLDLAGAPTQRVVLEPRSRLEVGFPIRGSEYGRPRLKVRAELADREPLTAEARIRVLPDAPRQVLAWAGWVSADTELTFDLPDGASARTLRIIAVDEPLARWDEALADTVHQPVTALRDLLGVADAAALRYRLLAHSGRADETTLQDARRQMIDAYQRLLPYEVVADGVRPTGAFAAQPGGFADPGWTAQTLLVLRRIDREMPIDAALLDRSRGWLMGSLEAPETDQVLNDQPARTLQLRARTIYALLGASQPAGLDPLAKELLSRAGEAQDVETIAAVAEVAAFAEVSPELRDEVLSRLADYRYRRDDGSNWYPGAGPTASGASGRGAAIETTALAVRAYARAGGRWRSIAEEGRDYLVAQRLPDGGWGAAWLTSLAVRALTQLEPTPSPARGILFCGVDDAPLQRITFEGSRHEFEHLMSPAPGQHTVRLRFIGRGRPAYRVRMAYTQSDLPAPTGLVADAALDRAAAAVGEPMTLTVGVTNPGTERLNLVVAEVPLPAGLAPEGEPIRVGDTLHLPVGDLGPGERRTIQLALRPRAPATLQPFDLHLRALYNPGAGAAASLPVVTIS